MEPPQHTSTTCHDNNPRYIITIWMTGPSFGQERRKWCLRLALWMNFISTSSNSITRDWSYFHHIWDFLVSKLQNMCRDFRDAVDLEKQTNAGAIRRLENKTWGFFWIRWCCRHFLPFQLCHNINIVTTLSQQMSQLCHNKCHKNNAKNIDGEWIYQEMMTMTQYFRKIFASNFDDSYF